MKTYRNLFNEIISFENLHAAYIQARRGKRYKSEVMGFGRRLEENLLALQQELIGGRYRTGAYRVFYVYEPKKRLIAALPFRDRVVHHALIRVIEPIWEQRFIYDSYACRVGKGTHAGVERLTRFLRKARRQWAQTYVLKLDVHSYFPSINHAVLLDLLARRIKDRYVMSLIGEIVSSWPPGGGVGLPIGNLTSQFFANVYLHELDMFVKHILKARYYIRYMDDAVILHYDKRWLHETKRQISQFLHERLHLELNSKTNVFPAEQGINFLGYRIWWSHRLLRRRSVKAMRRKLKAFQRLYAEGEIDFETINASIQSWIGHAKHANTYRLRTRLFETFSIKKGEANV